MSFTKGIRGFVMRLIAVTWLSQLKTRKTDSQTPLRFCGKAGGRVDQVGPAYFTKVIYFMGEALAINPAPLILDKWSGNAYGMLLLDQNRQADFEKVFRFERIDLLKKLLPLRHLDNKQIYSAYVTDMNTWAQQVQMSAPTVEAWLFGVARNTQAGQAPGNPRILAWECLIGLMTQHGLLPR